MKHHNHSPKSIDAFLQTPTGRLRSALASADRLRRLIEFSAPTSVILNELALLKIRVDSSIELLKANPDWKSTLEALPPSRADLESLPESE